MPVLISFLCTHIMYKSLPCIQTPIVVDCGCFFFEVFYPLCTALSLSGFLFLAGWLIWKCLLRIQHTHSHTHTTFNTILTFRFCQHNLIFPLPCLKVFQKRTTSLTSILHNKKEKKHHPEKRKDVFFFVFLTNTFYSKISRHIGQARGSRTYTGISPSVRVALMVLLVVALLLNHSTIQSG